MYMHHIFWVVLYIDNCCCLFGTLMLFVGWWEGHLACKYSCSDSFQKITSGNRPNLAQLWKNKPVKQKPRQSVNLVMVCHDWCTPSFTGLTFQNESSISSVYSWTDASTTKLVDTWWTTVHQFLTFSASVCIQPAVTNSPYYATGSGRTAVGHFLFLARLSGTHWPKTFGIWSIVLTVTVAEDISILAVLVCSAH